MYEGDGAPGTPPRAYESIMKRTGRAWSGGRRLIQACSLTPSDIVISASVQIRPSEAESARADGSTTSQADTTTSAAMTTRWITTRTCRVPAGR